MKQKWVSKKIKSENMTSSFSFFVKELTCAMYFGTRDSSEMSVSGEGVGHGVHPGLPPAPLPVWWLRLSRPAEPWTLRTRTGRHHMMGNSQLQRRHVRGKAQHKQAARSGPPQWHSWPSSNRSEGKKQLPSKANKVYHIPYRLFEMFEIRELHVLGYWVVNAHKWKQRNQWLLLRC